MPFMDITAGGLAPQADVPVQGPGPSFWGETVPAAFDLGNSLVSASNAAGEAYRDFAAQTHIPGGSTVDPSFDPFGSIGGYEEYASRFAEADTPQDVANIKRRIDKELAAKGVLDRAGAAGFVASLGAGILDPINLIPIGGTAARAATLGRTALESAVVTARAGAVSSLAQSAALYATQETMTPGDMVFDVAAGTLLGGVLGGAAPYAKAGWDALASKVVEFRIGNRVIETGPVPFQDGQTRPLSDMKSYLDTHVLGRPAGDRVPLVDFHVGALPTEWWDTLSYLNPEFALPANELYVSGRTLRHVEDRRPGWWPMLESVFNDMDSLKGMVLPNPTAANPLERPWLYMDVPGKSAFVVELRPDGDGISAVTIITGVDKSRVNKALRIAESLGFKRSDLEVKGREDARGKDPASLHRHQSSEPAQWHSDFPAFGPEGSVSQTDAASKAASQGGSVGAAAVDDVGLKGETLKGAFLAEKLPGVRHQDPVIRTVQSPSLTVRKITQRLAENPLMMKKNAEGKASAVAAETRIKMWQAPLAQVFPAVDDLFVRYRTGKDQSFGAVAKIGVQDTVRTPGKLTRKEFMESVGQALRRGDSHPIPEVAEAAAVLRRDVFEPLKNEAVALGLLPEDVSVETAASYFMRVYNQEKIIAQRHEWRRIVADWLEGEQTAKNAIRERVAELTDQHKALTTDIRKLKRQIEGRNHTVETLGARREVASRLNQFAYRRAERLSQPLDDLRAQITKIGDDIAPTLAKIEELTAAIRAEKDAHPEVTQIEATMYKLIGANKKLQEGKELIDLVEGVEDYAQAIEGMRGGFAEGIKSARQQAQYTRVSLGLNELMALEKARAKLGQTIRPFRKALNKARKEYAEQQRRRGGLARGGAVFETRIRQEVSSLSDQMSGNAHAVEALEIKLAQKQQRLDKVRSDLERAVTEWNGKTADSAKSALKRRAGKEADRAPDKPRLKEADKAVLKATRKMANAVTRLERQELEDLADEITDRILGTPAGRLPYNVQAGGERAAAMVGPNVAGVRGPLKARSFNIPDRMIEDFLESDAEVVARTYTRTMSADIELTRQFGSIDMVEQMDDIRREYAQMIDRASTEAERSRLAARRDADMRDILAMRDRMRGTFALPTNPEGLTVRTFRVVRNINYLRLLGGMTVSAIPDIARAVMMHGFSRTFGDGLRPLMSNAKGFRLAAEEVKLAGTALDMVLDTRAMAIADVMDDYGRHSRFERGVQALSSRFGLVSLMAPWNTAMKQFVGVITQSRMLAAIDAIGTGTIKPAEMERLAFLGIDARMAERIAKQVATHGEIQDGGVRWANTSAWTDRGAVTAYRAAIVKEVDRTIVTPGQDKPLWMSTELGKLVGQFKTFGFASTQRVALAALQQRDMAALSGVILSVGLGMLSYALHGAFAGKERAEDPETWVKEGLYRSGVLFWMTDVMDMGGKVLGMSGSSRYASRSVTEALLGPTLGTGLDSVVNLGNAAATGDWTERDTSNLRRLIPFQNLFYLRSLFDAAEEGVNEGLGVPAQ